MTANEIRDLRAFLLVDLCRDWPRGKSARLLTRLANAEELVGTEADVARELAGWITTGHVEKLSGNALLQTEPHFAITAAGRDLMFTERLA